MAEAAKNAIGDTPSGKQALELVGKSAKTVAQTVNNLLLPLAAFNFGVEKAKGRRRWGFASGTISEVPRAVYI